MRATFRPLPAWPYHEQDRRPSTYKVGYSRTLQDLDHEIELLGGSELIIGVVASERDVRIDGQLRGDARPAHPGVEVSFEVPDGRRLTFHTDVHASWQANLRAVALGLESLRAVARYGITSGLGEQYAGFAALSAGGPDIEKGKVLVERAGGLRKALLAHHPDHGGQARDFADVAAYRDSSARSPAPGLGGDGVALTLRSAGSCDEASRRLRPAARRRGDAPPRRALAPRDELARRGHARPLPVSATAWPTTTCASRGPAATASSGSRREPPDVGMADLDGDLDRRRGRVCPRHRAPRPRDAARGHRHRVRLGDGLVGDDAGRAPEGRPAWLSSGLIRSARASAGSSRRSPWRWCGGRWAASRGSRMAEQRIVPRGTAKAELVAILRDGLEEIAARKAAERAERRATLRVVKGRRAA